MFGSKKKSNGKTPPVTRPKTATAFAPRRSPIRPVWGLVCVSLGVLAILAYASYNPHQPVFLESWLGNSAGKPPEAPASNWVGKIGATLAAVSYSLGGWPALFLAPIYLLWLGYLFFFHRAHVVHTWKFLLMVVTLLAFCGLAAMIGTLGKVDYDPQFFPNGHGGLLGRKLFNDLMQGPVGNAGSGIILGLIYALGLLFVFTDSPGQVFEGLVQAVGMWRERRAEAKKKRLEEKQLAKEAAVLEEKAAPKPASPASPSAPTRGPFPPPAPKKPLMEEKPDTVAPLRRGLGTFKLAEGDAVLSEKEPEEVKPVAATPPPKPAPKPEKEKIAPLVSGLKIIEEEKVERFAPAPPVRKGDYIFPTVDLLSHGQARQTDSAEFHQERAGLLVQTLAEFGVKVTPTEIHTGPVITRYEVTPAPGVRVEKIVNLDKNIALALKAEGVRIIAPVPGKGTVGIEVPNRQAASVCLREIIESRAWAESTADIPVVLGKDVTGKPIVADLTKMPHALIAGSTGAGKTVCINAIIASLLFKMSPKDLRFIMVDPKIVEMQVFNDLPHMLVPVVTEPKKVPAALKYLISEMERRYQLFAQHGARNIAGFNAKLLKDESSQAKAAELDAEMSPEERAATRNIEVPRDPGVLQFDGKKLPYIICIIDELADLMMVAPADIETCVARLAQLARAAGIHLILATQRPSVNVITGVIKANLPCRIAFKVASKVDSRTILDTGGADTLIGRGDMLFVPPGAANLVRAQGALVSDEEINGLVEFLKRNGPPEFADDVQAQIEAGGLEEGEEGEADDEQWDDSLVPAAIGVLKATKRASTSMLQRRLKIGYNRAARIMEILEAEGIVGPENGSNPREILKDLELL